MRHIGRKFAVFFAPLGLSYAAYVWAAVAPPVHTIYAPDSAQSGVAFVAAWDATGCGNKPPVVDWVVPVGCSVVGQGQATVRITCLGARGGVVPIVATASAGRPPSTCNGSATASVVLAGGPTIPCCPKVPPFGDGAEPDPVSFVAPSTFYYQPGLASTGRLGLRVGVAVCQECPSP